MARKFAAVWHERRWRAAGGDLVHPLLGGEDSEEQAHEVCVCYREVGRVLYRGQEAPGFTTIDIGY